MSFNCKFLINYIRTNSCYTYFLATQLLAGLSLFIYILSDPTNNIKATWVDVIEWILLVCIIMDVGLKLFAQKKNFFHNVWNLIDLIAVVCISIMMISLIYVIDLKNENNESTEGSYLFAIFLLIFRYIILLVRITLTINESRKLQQEINNNDFNFDLSKKDSRKETELASGHHEDIPMPLPGKSDQNQNEPHDEIKL